MLPTDRASSKEDHLARSLNAEIAAYLKMDGKRSMYEWLKETLKERPARNVGKRNNTHNDPGYDLER